MKKLFAILFTLAMVLSGCGGGGGGGSSQTSSSSSNSSPSTTTSDLGIANAVAVTVDKSMGAYNRPYVSVTVCSPGSTQCATVDHVLVDTGSVGLRLLRSALPGSLSLANATDPANGSTLGECAQFASGYLWGPIVTADVKMSAETASAIPVQIVDNSFASVPSSCSDYGGDITSGLSANGIIGLNTLVHDCGGSMTCNAPGTTTYYDCTGSTCKAATVASASQVPNPVSQFAKDNNGINITLPAVPAGGGSGSVSGVMTFGINTQANNAIGSATQLEVSLKTDIKATFNGVLDWGFLDTGSSSDNFEDASIATCSESWYCPGSNMALSATLAGVSGGSQTVNFNIGNAVSEVNNGNAAYSDIGVNANLFSSDYFDLGLPFFFGKTIYFGFPSNDDFTGTWPYVAIQS